MTLLLSRGELSSMTKNAFDEIKNPDDSRKTILGLIKLLEFSYEMRFREEIAKSDFAALAKRYIKEVKSAVHHKLVFDLLWNVSDASRAFCKSIIDTQIHELIIANLEDNEAFQLANLNKKPKQGDIIDLLCAFLSIFNNTLRNYPESRSILSATNLKYSLKKLLDVEDLFVRSVVVICLAYVMNEKNHQNQEMLSLTKGDLEFLIKHMLPLTAHVTMDEEFSQSVKYNENTLGLFSSNEIFQPLALLATNPGNAREMIKLGIISASESALKNAYETRVTSENEYSSSDAATVKWSLRLLVELNRNGPANALIDFQDIIAKFTNDEEDGIAQDARKLVYDTNKDRSSEKPLVALSRLENLHLATDMSINDNVDEQDCEKERTQRNDARSSLLLVSVSKLKKSDKSHIMISYSHAQKNAAHKLLKELRKSGVQKIWIDIEHMHKGENIMDEMVNAVDGATYVICCISEDYHKSENCMCEISYARSEKKIIIPVVVQKGFTPEKKLKMYIGEKFRFDLSTEENFRLNYPLLLQKLNALWNI